MNAAKRIVVTGGSGFLGSYIVNRLRAGGNNPVIPRRADYDLRQQHAVQQLLTDHRPQVVFHLAANVGGIGANREHPAHFFYDNLMMGAHIIHECWRAGVEKLVIVGTVCSYPKHTATPFWEGDLWAGYPEETNAPYGIAKKALLTQAQAYYQQYGFSSVYVLPTNLYGERDNFNADTSHVIPALILKCITARNQNQPSVVLWGDGSPSRDFLYADDAAEGILRAADVVTSPEPINLGSGQEVRIADLALLIAQLTGYKGRFEWDARYPNGQPRRVLDTTRARQRLGWEAKTPLVDGLRATIAWYECQN